MIRSSLLLGTVLCAGSCLSAEVHVANAGAFDDAMKKAVAGDTIVLQSGDWPDADLWVRGHGEEGRPITVRAEDPGKVRLTGKSRLRLAGEHLVVEGLWFRDCFPEKADIVSFREDSKTAANQCVLRNCAITQDTVAGDSRERKWVSLYGAGHTVERCHFAGKTSKGTLLVVWLGDTGGPPPCHQIKLNYFGSRPRLGGNGGEIIRVGDSDSSMQRAECVEEGNYFEKCDGEVECISNKSCGNTYRHNTFEECQGTLTLRHGNGCTVEGNVFRGNHRKETGGIRVIGEDHVIQGNLLAGLEGDEARSAICLMNALENPPLNGYFQVKRALVLDNTILDCKESINIGYADKDVKAPLPPVGCRIEGNYVAAEGRKLVQLVDATAKITWKDNTMWGSETGVGENPGISLNERRLKRQAPPTPSRSEIGAAWFAPRGAK